MGSVEAPKTEPVPGRQMATGSGAATCLPLPGKGSTCGPVPFPDAQLPGNLAAPTGAVVGERVARPGPGTSAGRASPRTPPRLGVSWHLAPCRELGWGVSWLFRLLASEHPMRHVRSALVQNVPGVLSHMSGMLASRGYNIDSLAVEADPHARMTFVVVGDDAVLEPVASNWKDRPVVRGRHGAGIWARPVLIRWRQHPAGGRDQGTGGDLPLIVDVAADAVMIEISGRNEKLKPSSVDALASWSWYAAARSP